VRRKPRPAILPPLAEKDRERVRDVVRQELMDRKFGKQRAEDIANAVFHELSTPPPPTE
jgi:hypothetical protein